jgi:predicted RNA-binding Zn ribbon-like protein
VSSSVEEIDLRGGHPVLDFVNTVAWRGDPDRRIDYLERYFDLVTWCRRAGLVTSTEASTLNRANRSDSKTAERSLVKGKRLRESLHAQFTGAEPADLTQITEAYLHAMRDRRLHLVDGGIAWTERQMTLDTPVDRLAVEAVALMTGTPQPPRVKQCGDSACGWLFLDSSHRQNRRWCSAADCGNRDRARRHYERSRNR